jgi:hypothetical protein
VGWRTCRRLRKYDPTPNVTMELPCLRQALTQSYHFKVQRVSAAEAYAVLKHTLTRSLGIAAVRANARMRVRVLFLLSKGGTSLPVGSAADENRHFEAETRKLPVAIP